MSQYTDGTVSLIQNSATVVGASTNWLTASNVKVGDLLKKQGENAWYQVTSVNLATNLNISPVYAAASVYSVDYLVTRDFTPNYDWPEITSGDVDWQDIYTRALRAIDSKVAQAISGAGIVSAQRVTASHRVQTTDNFIVGSMTAGNIASVFLPTATPARALRFAVSSGSLCIVASASDTIAGNATKNIVTQYDAINLYGDGATTWFVI